MTTQQILEENGLDFNISKRPLFDNDMNPSGYFGLYNDKINKCINTVKGTYQVSQNKEVVDLILEGVKPFESVLSVQKGGIINEGRKVFLQLDIEGDADLEGDTIKKYITVIDSNDGSTSLAVGTGDLTMSCMNQFFKFYRNAQHKFRHTTGLREKMRELPFLIESNLEESFKRIEIYRGLMKTSIHKELAHKMVNELLGYDRITTTPEQFETMSSRALNIMETMYDCIDIEMNDKGVNAWGLHSGITRFTSHHKSVPQRENGRTESLLFGGVYKMNQKSLDFVTALS